MMDLTQSERIAVIETKISNIEMTNQTQNDLLCKIDAKLDNVIKDKTDKKEFYSFRDKVNKFILGLVASLIAAIAFLLKYTLFK